MATIIEISVKFDQDLEIVEPGSGSGKFELHRPDHYGLGGLVKLDGTSLYAPEALIEEFLAKKILKKY